MNDRVSTNVLVGTRIHHRCDVRPLPLITFWLTALMGLSECLRAQDKILFIRGGTGTVGFLEGGADGQAASVFSHTTASSNHGWGELGLALQAEGYELVEMAENPVVAGVPTPVPLHTMDLSQFAIIVFGSNNADYTPAQVNAFHTYIQNGGGGLFISDANFGQNWGDAPSSDQSFLTFYGLTMNQDNGFYGIERAPSGRPSDFLVPSHPIFNGVNVFDGEGVSPITRGTPPSGVTSTILSVARLQVKRNTGAAEGPNQAVTANDASLVVATYGSGRVVGHYDRNTFFNANGAGTNINNWQNEFYARNLFNWIAKKPDFNVATGNYAPRGRFTNLTNGAVLSITSTHNLDVQAKDSDGTLAYVDLFLNGQFIIRDLSAPYQLPVSTLVSGANLLTAVIMDNEGKSTTVPLAVTGVHPSDLETPLARAGWVLTSSVNNSPSALLLAIDGNASTRWATGQNQTNGQTLNINLGVRQTFHRILLETAASPNDFPRGFTVLGSDDGISYTTLATGAGNSATTSIAISPPATFSHVRIVQTGSSGVNWWAIHELNVFRPPANNVMPKSAWLRQYFTSADLADPSKQSTHWGDLADLDGDGLNTLAEFAFGSAPNNLASRATVAFATDIDNNSQRYMDFTFRRWRTANGVNYGISYSNDLSEWTSSGLNTQFIGQPVPNFDGTETVVLRLFPPAGSQAFGRVFVN